MSENKRETVSMTENELMGNDDESNITKDEIVSRISTECPENCIGAEDIKNSFNNSSEGFQARMDANSVPLDSFTSEQNENDCPFQEESDNYESITRDKDQEHLNENRISFMPSVDPPQDASGKPHSRMGLSPPDDSKQVSKSRFAQNDETSTNFNQRHSIESCSNNNDFDRKRDEYVRAGTRIRGILSNTLRQITDGFLAVIEEETKTRTDEPKLLSSSRDKRKRSEANSQELDQHSRPLRLAREEVNHEIIDSGVDERFLDNKHAAELAREKTIEVFSLKRVRFDFEQQNLKGWWSD